MLSENQMLDKLYTQPEIFNKYIEKKQYAEASYCVECARIIALFMELSDRQLIELFGSKEDPENVVEGLFSEEKVLRAMEWCIFHNKSRQDLTEKDRAEREKIWRTQNLPAKTYLTRLKNIDKLIATIYKELAYAQAGTTPSSPKFSAVPSKTNGISKPTEDKAVDETALQEQLASYRKEYVELKTTAVRLINKIKNNSYQMVLYKYYLQNMTLYETAEDMCISYQYACTLRNNALNEFQKLMDAENIQ